jgi:RarD protein
MKILGRKVDLKAIKSNLRPLILSGFFLGLNWVFLFAAYVRISVAVASLLNYTAPIMVVIIAPFLYKERIRPIKAICIITAFIGVVLTSGIVSVGIGNVDLIGITLPVLAALAFVGIVICNKSLKGIDSYNKAIVQLAASAVTVLPYVLYNNRGKSIELDLRSIILVLLLGAVHTGVAYCLYFESLGALSVQSIAILGYLEPVVSVLGSVFVLHQSMDLYGWIGAALIIFSSAASELIGSKKSIN